jgi:hypothetical protein
VSETATSEPPATLPIAEKQLATTAKALTCAPAEELVK